MLSNPLSIASLPVELVRWMYSKGILSTTDMRTIRLVCHKNCELATEILFHTIRISQLRHDSTMFRNIFSTPRLASHVQTVD
jgi:hypothetical protein